ncbi:unnamed protein product [Heligmosomoides polygyrus]|uniref:EH_Signature domain-containing protein n=1 Tax=Heligmosomoides polygyrus TaxID=6339 RepID=A0A183GSV1_HELPZ|nr:unnamed protein product [Heligmosomoides polygyrus]
MLYKTFPRALNELPTSYSEARGNFWTDSITLKDRLYHFFSAYAPQTGCSDQAKDEFWSQLMRRQQKYRRKMSSLSLVTLMEAHNLAIVNTVFRKRDSHIISFYSGNTRTQIDFVLMKGRDRRLVTDAKVVPYETVAHSIDC